MGARSLKRILSSGKTIASRWREAVKTHMMNQNNGITWRHLRQAFM